MAQERRQRLAFSQSALYVASFFNSAAWFMLYGLVNSAMSGNVDPLLRQGESGLYTFQLLSYLFYPLEGFFNALIFFRPRVLQVLKREPETSVFTAYKSVLLNNSSDYDNRDNINATGSFWLSFSRGFFPHVSIVLRMSRSGGNEMELASSSRDPVDETTAGATERDLEAIGEAFETVLDLSDDQQP